MATLADFGLAPATAPNTPATPAPATSTSLPPAAGQMPDTPSPADDPKLWISFTIATKETTYNFPPTWDQQRNRGNGKATVECASGIKVDKQTASGKSKAKLKIGGREALTAKIKIEWWADAWGMAGGVCEMLTAIDPNSPEAGGPFDFSHPDFNRRGGKAIVIEKVGKIDWNTAGTKGTCELDGTEFDAAAQATGGAGGTKVPTKADTAGDDAGGDSNQARAAAATYDASAPKVAP